MTEVERVSRRGDRRRQLLAIDNRAQFEERRQQVRRQEERERWDAFALWLRDRRQATGRSQAQCAKRAGMGQAQWNRIENSVHGTPIEKMRGIALAIDVDLSEVLRAAGYGDQTSDEGLDGGDARMQAPASRADMERLFEELREIRSMLAALTESHVNR